MKVLFEGMENTPKCSQLSESETGQKWMHLQCLSACERGFNIKFDQDETSYSLKAKSEKTFGNFFPLKNHFTKKHFVKSAIRKIEQWTSCAISVANPSSTCFA